MGKGKTLNILFLFALLLRFFVVKSESEMINVYMSQGHVEAPASTSHAIGAIASSLSLSLSRFVSAAKTHEPVQASFSTRAVGTTFLFLPF